VRVFSTACNSASMTTTVSKWQPFSFIFNRENREKFAGVQVRQEGWVRDDSHIVFGKKIPWWKRKCETVCCHDATASSLVA
jgi:hypothetical protein